jgi:hypothetical protein
VKRRASAHAVGPGTDNAAAAMLLAFALAVILWANSPWAHSYSPF